MIIVYKEIKDNKIEFTKEELEALLEQAKQEGYNDGYKDGIRNTTHITTPTKEYYPQYPQKWNEIMCSNFK